MWRHFFAAIPATMILVVIIGFARRPSTSYSGPLTEAERRGEKPAAFTPPSDASKLTLDVLLVLCVASAIFFFIDSIRRTYRSSNTIAIALAFMGLITFGAFSLIYYLIWGRERLRPAEELYGDGVFCPRCLERSSDRAAPSTLSYDAFFGTRPMGAADRCSTCKSVVRTIWLWLGVPVLPIGSYRMIATGKNEYVGRRTGMRWMQVLPVYAIALLFLWAISNVLF
jgi:hypothetical protein